MLKLANELINFDPDFLNVGMSFLSVACKYAMVFGISTFLIRMLVRTSTGKERLL